MKRPRLLVARARARLALLVPVASVLAAAVALPLLAIGIGDAGAESGAATVLAAQPAHAAAAVVTQQLGDTPATQATRVRAAIADRLPAGSAHVTWSASVTAAVDAGSTGQEARITAVPSLPSVTHVVSGTWPVDPATRGPVPTAVQADAARRLGLRVGDTVAVGPRSSLTLRVAATWRADDAGAAVWSGASDVGSGTDDGVAGPFVVPAGSISGVPGSATATWTITPTTDQGRLVAPDGLRRGLRAVSAATSGDTGPLAGADVSGTLAATLARIDVGIATARALVRIGIAIAAVLGVVAVSVLFVLLRDARTREDALFTARGATRAQLVRWTCLEALVVAGAGAVVGAVVAVVLAGVLGHGATPPVWVGVLTPVVAVVVAVATAGVVAARRTSSSVGTTGTWVAVVLTVAVVAAAAFATWRLFTVGVPVSRVRGQVETDPIAAVSPVVTVFASALVTVVLVGVVAALVARAVPRWRGFLPGLVVRRLARTWASTAPVVVLVAMAVAVGGLAAGLAATTSAVDDATASAVVGPAVRVSADGDDAVDDGVTVVAPTAGVTGRDTVSTPVLTDEVTAGDRRVPLVAMPAAAATDVLGRAGAAAFRDVAVPGRAGTALPAGARRVEVTVRAGQATLDGTPRPDARGAVRSALWVADQDGVAAELPLTADDGADVALGETARLHAVLPITAGARGTTWRLLAVEPTLTFSSRPADVDAGITPSRLRVTVAVAVADVPAAAGDRVLEDLGALTRIPLGAAASGKPLPVVVTTALAAELGLRPGSPLDLGAASTARTLHTRVAGVVERVPGSASTTAVAADLPALVDASVLGGPAVDGTAGAVPRVDETWIAGPDPTTLAAQAARNMTVSGSVSTRAAVSSTPVLTPAVGALAGVAAFGTLLALLAFVGGVVSSADPQRSATSRALGVSPAAAGRARVAELVPPVVAATLGGLVGGGVTVATVAAPFAIAAVPGATGLVTADPVVVSAGTFLVPVVVLTGAGLLAAVAGRRTRRAVAEGGRR
ncbi:hypothetical protein ITJ54_07680 [Curtobacterium sp. VKM Ac-2865]|uniref:FtsX-like permease family protein n=1 Tax=Curtobacterium sp. VKM Ac-2865 TaxID=2783817 RepID=UPI00188D04F0|nr:FtsX-like permease family protein [Curtobacterium sp. VKM Ac-2865]MBF4582545.1 hypothetical protein [Curtobacterium sp. VKM Ac-2865]